MTGVTSTAPEDRDQDYYNMVFNTPDLISPLTGVIVDDYLYFIADTQGKRSKLKGVVVMKTRINK